MSEYWLYQWLDENEIHAEWEIYNALGGRKSFKRLADRQEEDSAVEASPEPMPLQRSIVVGRSLDLSGRIACGGYDCLRRDVDAGFLRIWHYFDGIVVSYLDPRVVHRAAKDENDYDARTIILDYIRILLYMRSIGAEPWISFVNKDQKLSEHDWSVLSRSLNVADAFEGERHEKIVRSIAKSTRFNVQRLPGNHWDIRISGGYFKSPTNMVISHPTRPTIEYLSRRILRNYGQAALVDVAAARELSLPLMQPASVPWIGNKKHTPAQEEVALELNLPVFSDLKVADFLKLREDERPAFEEFRKGLRDQIRTQLGSATADDTAVSIARNIEDDYLRPGLAEIEQRIRGSRKAVIKKSALGFGIATSVATISAISSVPMMIAGSVVALGSAVPLAPLIGSHIDEMNKEIPMHELYFLWRLKKQGKHWSKHR